MRTRQTVVITGASTGIGEACARFLVDKGFQVFAGVRKQADAERLTRNGSSHLVPLFIDVTDGESISRAADTVSVAVRDLGLAGLVNNAGVVVGGPLEIVPIERLRRQLEVNLIGQVEVTQTFLPLLRQAGGRLVNMGSISGRIASPMLGPYAMSKYALEAFSDSLRRELVSWGIQVSIVEPGAIATPIWDKSVDRVDHVLKDMPENAKRLYADDIEAARLAARKMSDEAIPAIHVAKAVHHALTTPRPRTRYLVGKDAKIAARMACLLPDRVMDWMIRKSRRL